MRTLRKASQKREKVDLPRGQSFRLLRWVRNLRNVDVVLSPFSSVSLGGEGDHWHYHQACELTWFESGEGTRFVGDHIGPFGPGDIVLLGENLPHYWHASGPSKGIAVQWLFTASHPLWRLPEMEMLDDFFQKIGRGLHFRGATATRVSAQLQQLLKADRLDRLGLFLRILSQMATAPEGDIEFLATKTVSLSKEFRHQSAIQAAMRYLFANFRSEIRLNDVLRITRMSKPTFSRQFKLHTGKTLNEMLQQIRIETACRELAGTDGPVIDVAFGTGFSDLAFFYRLFRRLNGCSPQQYRHRVRRSQSS